jgi:starch-binding outer membrane protein, SusD/RagB family
MGYLTMKNKIWVAPLALSMALAGCDNPLVEQPESFLTVETFYRTPADLESGVHAIYSSLRRAYLGISLPPGENTPLTHSFNWNTLELASDQARVNPGETSPNNVGMDRLNFDPRSAMTFQTNSFWSPFYAAIFRANLVIERAPGVAMDEARKAEWVAEARFLRAYAYLQLSKMYSAGSSPQDLDVPLVLNEADHLRAGVTRATTAEVHAQILQDLTAAEAALPVARTGAAVGRATRAAAQMALADFHAWRSSFLTQNEWQQASDWAKRVIDSNRFALNPSFFGTFLPSNKAGNPEMIFRIVAAADGRTNSTFTNIYFPRELGFSPQGGGHGIPLPTQWHLNTFADGDIRGRVGPQSDSVAYRTTGCSLTASIGCRTFVPHVWKYRPTSVDNSFGDVDVPLYRFAETLLLYAEAQNELGNSAEAIRNVNLVRERARRGMGNENRAQPANYAGAMDRLAVREAVYLERNRELAHEAKRWFDLVRRDSLEPGYWRNSLLANSPNVTAEAAQGHKKRWPIPGPEIDVMPTLAQNPGY